MEVIEISKKQLIFLLDRIEVYEYDLDKINNSTLMRSGFRRLITDNGFGGDFLSDVLVQIFDSKSGGLQMFVTKLSDNIGLFGSTNDTEKKFIYIFPSLDRLLLGCKYLFDKGVTGGSAFAKKDKGRYFLALQKEERYLSEFGGSLCKDSAMEYLTEFCSLISDNAVEKLSALT